MNLQNLNESFEYKYGMNLCEEIDDDEIDVYDFGESDDLTADEIAYERYKNGEYSYEDYRNVCDTEECEPEDDLDEGILDNIRNSVRSFRDQRDVARNQRTADKASNNIDFQQGQVDRRSAQAAVDKKYQTYVERAQAALDDSRNEEEAENVYNAFVKQYKNLNRDWRPGDKPIQDVRNYYLKVRDSFKSNSNNGSINQQSQQQQQPQQEQPKEEPKEQPKEEPNVIGTEFLNNALSASEVMNLFKGSPEEYKEFSAALIDKIQKDFKLNSGLLK